MISFQQLGLSKQVLKVLTELGFENPTEIQQKAIPQLISGHSDFIGLAQTGTGKTAAFGIPLIERIDPSNKATQALIIAPTRELGQQIAEQVNTFGKYREKINTLAVYGGAAISNQIKALKKPQHIIIATPGRLIDLIKRKAVNIGQLEFIILDEADEMLNMGFKEDIDHILSYAPDHIQTWLFSATMPSEIKRIVDTYMNNPVEIRIDAKNVVNTNIDHQYVMVNQKDKSEALSRFLDIDQEMRGVVFCRTRRDTQNLADQLLSKGYRADALHGDLSQKQRDRVMKRFKDHDLQVLVATDVAARGIDVNDLSHVFHHSLPDDLPYYTHRSGRTARAGKKGVSLVLINGREKGKINRMEKHFGINFTRVMVPKTEDIADTKVEKWCQDILKQKSKALDPETLEVVKVMFGNLSKDELIAKFLKKEMNEMNLGSSRDINAREESSGKKRNGGKKGGYKGKKRQHGGQFSGKKKNKKGGRPHHKNKRRKGKK